MLQRIKQSIVLGYLILFSGLGLAWGAEMGAPRQQDPARITDSIPAEVAIAQGSKQPLTPDQRLAVAVDKQVVVEQPLEGSCWLPPVGEYYPIDWRKIFIPEPTGWPLDWPISIPVPEELFGGQKPPIIYYSAPAPQVNANVSPGGNPPTPLPTVPLPPPTPLPTDPPGSPPTGPVLPSPPVPAKGASDALTALASSAGDQSRPPPPTKPLPPEPEDPPEPPPPALEPMPPPIGEDEDGNPILPPPYVPDDVEFFDIYDDGMIWVGYTDEEGNRVYKWWCLDDCEEWLDNHPPPAPVPPKPDEPPAPKPNNQPPIIA